MEGPGDVAAVHILLRRIIGERLGRYDIDIIKPKPANGRGRLLKRIENFVSYAALEVHCDGILVLLDSDKDCPVALAQGLSPRCTPFGIERPVAIVCAQVEYEAWFLASLSSIRGHGMIPETASITGNPEDIGNPKQWFTDQMPQGRAYKETAHQASLTNVLDLDLAHTNSRSFRRLCHAVEQLVGAMENGTVGVTPQP